MLHRLELQVGSGSLSLSSGEMARQADGAVVVRCGGTVVLATAVVAKTVREGIDFLPLTVDYIEKHYAAGKIPGGFFKREGRPGERETLTSRLIDRALRPLFPDNFANETQVIAIVLSADQENDPDVLALVGASAALSISPIPFMGPIGGVRVGEVDGKLVINPSGEQLQNSPINLVVAGSQEAIVMVEGQAQGVTEDKIIDAIFFAHQSIKEIIELQHKLRQLCGKTKMEVVSVEEEPLPADIEAQVRKAAKEGLKELIVIAEKQERQSRLTEFKEQIVARFAADDEPAASQIKKLLDRLEKEEIRQLIIGQGIRPDGRRYDQIRPISCQIGVLPRTHGSALFTRGETQALAITTLGTAADEQKVDNLEGEYYKSFMLHYNFPPFSVGEVKFLRSPGRREIGHGSLAEKAIKPILPDEEEFPYTIRIVSDILESNGSSSMATVCGASLSLMDAGVPVKDAVAGIAMGLIKQDGQVAILSDIIGLEDHCGDMDFKVAGTREGINAIQMDIKIRGITREIIQQALEQAKQGRLYILDKMAEVIAQPRPSVSPYAPRIYFIQIKPEKVRDVIGPGGKTIKGIIEQTGVEIDIEDDGKVTVASSDEESAKRALQIIEELTQEVELDKVYLGKVKRIVDFGAFVEILPNTDGLLHISQIANYRIQRVEDELKVGDELKVKVIEIDPQGRIRLSRKVLLREDKPKEVSRIAAGRR
jgi:polyribonucleotide nucleotidyltransferase